MQTKIVILDDYQGAAYQIANWARLGDDVVIAPIERHVSELEELRMLLRDANVVVAMRERTRLDRDLFERLPNLHLVVTTGMTNAAIDVGAATACGITVSGTGGYLSPTTELTWGLLLALARHIPDEDRAIRNGMWQHTMGVELAGKTLAVLGLGRVGRQVSRIAQAFEMRTIAWSQNLTPSDASAIGVEYVARETLFREADVLTIHLVLSDRTRHLIGNAEFGLMKREALLVNTSRGPIVEEAALIDALRTGQIAGAALDVYEHEPLSKDHPLRSLANTVLTPHIGYVTDSLYRKFYQEIVEDIDAWLRGAPIRLIDV